jgi:hypothetical protein
MIQTNNNLSYPIKDYITFALIINEKTKYGIGDSYPIIKEVLFLMKNNLDITAIVKAFGFQQRYIYSQPVGNKESLFERLREVLKDDLFKYNSKQITEINNDWLKKKITYKI